MNAEPNDLQNFLNMLRNVGVIPDVFSGDRTIVEVPITGGKLVVMFEPTYGKCVTIRCSPS